MDVQTKDPGVIVGGICLYSDGEDLNEIGRGVREKIDSIRIDINFI